MKKLDCVTKVGDAGTTLYIKSLKPQPPGPPPPPPPPLYPKYDAINVWPMPINVSLCGNTTSGLGQCLGPHTVVADVTITYSGCSKDVAPLGTQATNLGTTFRAPLRTYDEPPYERYA